jgi:hypothetical protein
MHLSVIFIRWNKYTSMYVVPLEVMSSASIFAIYIIFIENHIASPEKVFHMSSKKLSKYFSNYAQNW